MHTICIGFSTYVFYVARKIVPYEKDNRCTLERACIPFVLDFLLTSFTQHVKSFPTKKISDARWQVHDSGRAVITKCIFGNTTLQPSILYTLVHVYGLHTSVIHVWTVQITELQKGMQLTISTDSTRYTLRKCPLHSKNLSRRGVLKKSDYHGGCTLHATQCSYSIYCYRRWGAEDELEFRVQQLLLNSPPWYPFVEYYPYLCAALDPTSAVLRKTK